MTTPLVIPNASVGDAVLVDRNAMGSLISAAYNAIPGDNINANSVPTSALAKPKAKFPYRALQYIGTVSGATFSGVTGLKQVFPYVDGVSNSTWVFLHATCVCRTLTGATGTLDLLKNGVSMSSGVGFFNFASMTSGTPAVNSPAAPVTFNSFNGTTDNFQWSFSALGGTITDIDVTLWFSLNHVGT